MRQNGKLALKINLQSEPNQTDKKYDNGKRKKQNKSTFIRSRKISNYRKLFKCH